MSEFSSLLSEYIHQKGYSIRGLAQHLGIPSATLTKLCNSTRGAKNQRQNVERICNALMLTPAQRERLTASFEAELVGVEVYTSRISEKNLIENMDGQPLSGQRLAGAETLPMLTFSEKENDTYAMLRTFLGNAVAGGTLDLVLAPGNAVVFEALRTIVKSCPIKVRHIVPMLVSDKSTGMVSSENIVRVQRLAPLFLGGEHRDASYMPYYYYERTVSAGNMLQFPNVLISAEGVLLCTANYAGCIYTAEKNAQRYFGRLFNHQLSQCRPLISVEPDIRSQLRRYIRMAEMAEGSTEFITVGWQPCLVHCITPADVERLIPEGLPFRGEYIQMYLHYLRCLARHKTAVSFFTLDGLVDFARTGCLREVPKDFLGGAMPVALRRMLLERILQDVEEGRLRPYLVREDIFKVSRDAQIIYYGADTVSLAGMNADSTRRVCFIEELSTNWSVLDFLEHLENSKYSYSLEESCTTIRDVIEKYLPATQKGSLRALHGAYAPSNGGYGSPVECASNSV